MAQNKETRIPKTSTFEEWRQSSNQVSFDLGPIESDSNKNADSLDKETRLTDQAKTINVSTGVSTATSADVGASAPWQGWNEFFALDGSTGKGALLGGFGGTASGLGVGGTEIDDQKFSVAVDGDITLASNTSVYANNDLRATTGGTNYARSGGDGGAYLEFNTFQKNTAWRGKTLQFTGDIQSSNLHSRYAVEAYIRTLDVNNGYALLSEAVAVITSANDWDISLDIEEGSNVEVQVGFTFGGRNAEEDSSGGFDDGSMILENVELNVSIGASEIIDLDEEFIRDQSNGSNDVGMRIDLATDKKLDMTAGYIIIDNQVAAGAPADFTAGNSVHQFTGNSSSNAREFAADIIGVVRDSTGNNIAKLLITNAVGTFNPGLNLGSADNYATQQILAARLVRQVVGSLDFGYVRVYKTNSGTTTKLEQNVTTANGFHLPRATFALPFSASTTLPASFIEGERIYQTTDGNVESASNIASFSAVILTGVTSSKYGLGTNGGFILYDVIGTFNPARRLRGTTTGAATVEASKFTAAHTDCVIDNTFSSIIRLNTPAVTGDTFEIEFASAVDAIVEVQDDIGKIEDLATNTVQAGFGATGDRKAFDTTDLVTTLNTLQDMIGNAEMPIITNNTHLVPANVNTISGLAKSVVDFIGNTDLSDANLGATANTSSTLTDAITTIKTFIGSTDISDITTGENITTTIAQLHDEVGDVTTLDATGSATAGGFDTEVLTTALIELRTLVCPGDIDDAQAALSANVAPADNFVATTNTDGIVELQTIVGDRTGISVDNLIGTAAATNTIVGQINHIKAEIGTAALLTTSNGDIASAINELETNIRGTVNNYTITDNLPSDITYTVDNGIITAVNTLTSFVGNTSLDAIGTSNTITSAVDKMHTELGEPDTLNATTTAYNDTSGEETDGVGGFRNAVAETGSEATVVSALTELRQALVGNTANLAAVTNARVDTTTSATIQNAITDLANLAGYSKTNVIDSILEIQDLMGDVTSLNNATNDFDTNRITDSLIELKTALVGAGDLTTKIATLDDDSTDFAGTNVVDAITEIQADLGQQSLLTASPFHADLYTTTDSDVYASTDFQLAINGITAAIGSHDIGAAVNTGNETLTNAIAQLRTDIGDVGASGVNLTTTAGTLGGAANELHAEIGEVLDLDNAVGYTQTTLVPAITEIQGLIGNPVATTANLGSINTRVQKDTDAEVDASERTITLADTTGIVAGMTVLNIETGRTSSIAAGTKVITVNADNIIVDTDVVSTINSGDTLRFDVSTVVNAINAIDAGIGQEINPTTMGTTAATLVPAIKEITDELGDVTASNLGTTSSTIVTSIRELVDGTDAATVTVKNTSGQQPTGKLNRVSASAQTLIGDIDFNSPGDGATNTTTLTFGANTVLDVSAGTLKMSSDAAGVFNVSSAFINLQPSANTGAGLQVDRSGITGATIETGEDAIIQWIESSVNTNNPASAHNTSDIAWHVKGLTSATSPADYNKPNVDFQNAYRLFGIGTTNVANSMSNVTVTWDATNHNFDVSLNDTTTDMTGGGSGPVGSSATAGLTAWGTTGKIPQIHVDRQGRIAGIAEVDMANFLGTFNVLGDSGTQTVASGNNLKFVGTAGEIETAVTDVSGTRTVTIGLPNNVDVDGTFGAAGNVNLVSGNAASSTITLGGSNTTTTIAGVLNIPGTLNVTGTNNSVTVSNTTITGDALVLRTEDNSVPANTDTPKFVINRGFNLTKNSTQLVAGKRYKIVSTTGDGFTNLGADNNNVGTVFTATGAGSSNTGTAKLQRDEAAIVWSEQYDQFILTRGGDAGAVSTNTQQGAIITQGDTIGSTTKFTAAANSGNEDKQVLFADVTSSTSQLQRNSGLLFNPSANKLTLSSGQLDLGNFKHLNGVTHINTATNAKPLHISRDGSLLSQVMKVGVSDREVIFNYIEDTLNENKNNFGTYKFLLNGNHGDADEVADRVALVIDKDRITTRGLHISNNGMTVNGASNLKSTNMIGLFTQERLDVTQVGSTLGHTSGSTSIGAEFKGRVTTGGDLSVLEIRDERIISQTDGSESIGSASKQLQHKINGTRMSFLEFYGTSGNTHFAQLGGISHGVRKAYFLGQGNGATRLYHNTADAQASQDVLQTKSGGINISGNLEADSADVTGNLVIRNAPFPSAQDPSGGADSNYNLAPASLLHVLKRNCNLQTTNVLATFEAHGSDYAATPGKISIDIKGQDTNNKTNFVRISQATVNDTDYGDNNEATSNLIFGATSNGVYGEKMIITGRGAVGIGTLNPTVTLDVDGTAKASSFIVERDAASEIKIQKATGNSTLINKVVLSNTNSNDKGGVIYAQSTQLGSTIGSSTTQATFVARNNNESYLQIIDERSRLSGSSTTQTWEKAHKRIEFGIDSTRMAYLAANWNENYGFEIGSAGRNSSDPFRSNARPWIRFRKAANYNGPGAVELYHGSTIMGGSTKKFETLDVGAKVTGQLSTTGKVGVGTDSPANDGLHVTNLTGSTIGGETMANAKLLVGTTANGIGLDNNEIVCSAGNFYIRTLDGSAGHINFGTGSTANRMVITDGGNVGINVGDEPAEKLDVGGNIKLSGIIDQNGTGTNDFEGQIDCNQDVKTTASGKGFYAFGGGSDYLTMTHDGAGGHIDSSDKLEISTPTFKVLSGNSAETLISATQNAQVDLYFNNAVKAKTMGPYEEKGRNYSGGLKIEGPNVAVASYAVGELMKDSTLQTGRIQFDGGNNTTDWAQIRYVSGATVDNSGWLDFLIGDDVGGNDRFRFRFDPSGTSINSGNEYTLIDIYPKSTSGSTFMDLTGSAGTDSEVKADTFTGSLTGNADTATTLSATLAVAKGGTGNTAFANKAVIISQDSGTDKLSAVTMATNGQLLIGGTSGPAAATLTAGTGIDITNANNSITITAEQATHDNAGVTKFSSLNFAFTGDMVRIKDLGVATAEIQNNAVTFAKIQNFPTDTIMGRTAAGVGDGKALTATEARGVLNVANGADKYSSFNIRANNNAGTAGAAHAIASGKMVAFQGVGATSITRSGGTVKISSTNTTYTAAGGTSSASGAGIYLDGTTFKIGYQIQYHTNQYIGNKLKTRILFHGNPNVDAGRTEDPYINFYTSQSGSRAMTMRVAKHMTGSGRGTPTAGNSHKAVLYGMYSAEVDKTIPTYEKELTSKKYVDAQREFIGGGRYGGGTGGSASHLRNCTMSRIGTGKYRITIAKGGTGERVASNDHYLIPALAHSGLRTTSGNNPSTLIGPGNDTGATGAMHLPAGKGQLTISTYIEGHSSVELKYIVEITEMRAGRAYWLNDDGQHNTKFTRHYQDSAFTWMFTCGRDVKE